MGMFPNSDWQVFTRFEKLISDSFTTFELAEIHRMAIRIDQIMKAVIERESNRSQH